jgi:conjugative coupling factor TraD (SXT/TOL subfamily)
VRDYPVNHLLREPTEIYSSLCCFAFAALTFVKPHIFLLTKSMGSYAAITFALWGTYRLLQALRIKRYHKHLFAMPLYALSTNQIPLSQEKLFVGKGFRWLPSHTQCLHHLKQAKYEKFLQKKQSKIKHALGGHAFLHGLGGKDKPIYIPQDIRVGHTFVVGTTRVGKTRLASLLINQDIRNGDAVIVVDPKGDLELVRDMVSACKASNRLDDFRVVHLGFPELSALYNPLKHYDQVSEVATRITDAIPAEGEGKQFAAFAWKYVNIVAICLEEMNEPITYKSIAFYISRLEQLLMRYADITLPQKNSTYHEEIEAILSEHGTKINRSGKTTLPMERPAAVIQYLKHYITQTIQKGEVETLQDQILLDLFDAATLDKHYYDKITASVGPVLSEINKSNASRIFSHDGCENEIILMDVIKKKRCCILGLIA